MKIATINGKSPFLSQVIELGDQNSNSLGFLPKVAFKEFASRGKILVALSDNDDFLGYLLFNFSKRNRITSITHLCIKESKRRQGIGEKLVERLKLISKKNSLGIRVHCRRDWEAHGFWPKMDFIALEEKSGRSKSGSILTVFWFDHEHPDLFSFSFDQSVKEKIHVAIDANILYDLKDEKSRNKIDSRALLADWLQDEIELCVTKEIYNEISRNEDPDLRDESRKFANSFTNIPFRAVLDQEKQEVINELFLDAQSEQDESDKRQIERTIAADIKYFITHDENLLSKSNEFKSKIGLSIWRPAELIIHVDRLCSNEKYYPTRIAGPNLNFSLLKSEQINQVEEYFLWPSAEKKNHFSTKLNTFASFPQKYESMVIKNGDDFLGLIVFNQEENKILDIPIIRTRRNHTLSPMFEFLILQTILKAASKNDYELIKISEPFLDPRSIKILQRHGFQKEEDAFWRVSKHGIFNNEQFISEVITINDELSSAYNFLKNIVNTLQQETNSGQNIFSPNLEKLFWPVKFVDLEINNFVVPIKPRWAIHLFDSKLGQQNLFGGKPLLVLLSENAYYRSAKPRVLEAPGRILWYVSNSKGPYKGVKAIRACSQLNEVIVESPKTLFNRFESMGIFNWTQVLKIADNDINKQIMAFRFSHTELFKSPIGISRLREIWKRKKQKNFHPQAPQKISNTLFLDLYSEGMGFVDRDHNE